MLKPDHGEMPVFKTKRIVARGAKAKQGVIPMMHAEHFFRFDICHDPLLIVLISTFSMATL